MKIKWLQGAKNDLAAVYAYIAADNPAAAESVLEKIFHTINLLVEQPALGRPGRFHHTRELIIADTPYIIPYRVKNNIIEILRIHHSSKQWPKNL